MEAMLAVMVHLIRQGSLLFKSSALMHGAALSQTKVVSQGACTACRQGWLWWCISQGKAHHSSRVVLGAGHIARTRAIPAQKAALHR